MNQHRLEDELTSSMHNTERQLPHGPSLLPGAMKLAQRKRRRRQITGATAAVAAAALAIPVGLTVQGLLRDGARNYASAHATSPTTGPTTGPTTSPTTASPTQSARPHKNGEPVRFTLKSLPKGAAPEAVWHSADTLHLGKTAVPFKGSWKDISSITKVADGAIVVVAHTMVGADDNGGGTDGDYEVFFVRQDGSRKSLGRGPGINLPAYPSADGETVVWASETVGPLGRKTKLTVYDLEARKVLRRKTIDGGAHVGGFLGDKVLLTSATNAAGEPIKIWDPAVGSVRTWYDAYAPVGITKDESAVAVAITGAHADAACFRMLSLPRKTRGWESCGYDGNNVTFSPDGKFLATVLQRNPPASEDPTKPDPDSKSTTRTDVDTADISVMERGTGKELLRIKKYASELRIAWENNDTFVFVVVEDASESNGTAIVRCTVAGSCERATDIQPALSFILAH